MNTQRAQQLVNYIRAHGFKAMYSLLDNVIYAASEEWGEYGIGTTWEWTAIEPKAQLVRDWLGY
jgi:hypothetical protein